MPVDVTSLHIGVDATEAADASDALDRLEKSTDAAESAADRLKRTASQTEDALRKEGTAAGRLSAELTKARSGSAGLAQSIGSLGRAARSGNIGAIAQQIGNVTRVAGPATAGVVTLVLAVTKLALLMRDGAREAASLDRAISSTGNAAGITADRVDAIVQAAHEASDITLSDARRAATAMVQSGRVGADTIANLTKSIAAYALITGQSTDQAASALSKMFDDPLEAARRLNDQFHFLSLEQYQYIRRLQDQGRSEEAATVASGLLADAIADQAKNLAPLDRAWQSLLSHLDEYADRARAVARPPKTSDRILQVQQQLQGLTASGSTGPGAQQQIAALRAELVALENEAAKAAQDSAVAAANATKIAADDSWRARAAHLRTYSEQLHDEVAKVIKEGQLLGKSRVEIQRQVDAITAELTPKDKPSETIRPAADAFAQQRVALAQDLFETQVKLAGVESGSLNVEQRRAQVLEAWLRFNEKGQKLLPGQVEQLRALAAEVDELNDRITSGQSLIEAKKRAESGIAEVNQELLSAIGRTAEAAAMRTKQQYEQLRRDLAATGDTAGLLKLDQLVNINAARAQLEELQRVIDSIFSDQGRTEQSIQLQVQAGLKSEAEARREIVDLYAQTAARVQELLPQYQQLAAASGDPRALENLKNMEAELVRLRTVTNDLQKAFGDAFEGSFSDAITNLITGVSNLREAATAFLRDFAASLARWVSEDLANRARVALMGLFNQGSTAGAAGGAGGAVAGAAQATQTQVAATALSTAGSTVIAGASQTSIAAGALGTAGQTVNGAAFAMQAAAARLLQAAQAAAAASTASTIGSSAASSFATGGYTGDGGKYQPAGIVHRGEFVTRSEVVREPGAAQFLDAFNRLGMRALGESSLPGYSDGGLVMAIGDGESAKPASVNNRMRVYLLNNEDELASRLAQHPAMEKAVVAIVGKNGNSIRAEW